MKKQVFHVNCEVEAVVFKFSTRLQLKQQLPQRKGDFPLHEIHDIVQ